MLPRFLVLLSVMVFEAAVGISNIMDINGRYPYGNMPQRVVGECISWVAGILIVWLLTIAYFTKKSARIKADKMIDDAKLKSAKILSDATEKALALCSLDSGKCLTCGNPRTGRYCPSCGKQAEAPKDKVVY